MTQTSESLLKEVIPVLRSCEHWTQIECDQQCDQAEHVSHEYLHALNRTATKSLPLSRKRMERARTLQTSCHENVTHHRTSL